MDSHTATSQEVERPENGIHRMCPACGCNEFRLWWRVDLPSIDEPTTITCAECGNSVGNADLQDPRMPEQYDDTEGSR